MTVFPIWSNSKRFKRADSDCCQLFFAYIRKTSIVLSGSGAYAMCLAVVYQASSALDARRRGQARAGNAAGIATSFE